MLGDFGRTPKITEQRHGRDHWNHCYSLMLLWGWDTAGADLWRPAIRSGAFPERSPLIPGDIVSTILSPAPAWPPISEIRDALNRPYLTLVPTGDVVQRIDCLRRRSLGWASQPVAHGGPTAQLGSIWPLDAKDGLGRPSYEGHFTAGSEPSGRQAPISHETHALRSGSSLKAVLQRGGLTSQSNAR